MEDWLMTKQFHAEEKREWEPKRVQPSNAHVDAQLPSGADLPGLQAKVEDVHGILVLVELSLVDVLDEDHSSLRVFPNLELIRS